MADYLKDFTHVIAIDFGTGESGYALVANSSNKNTKPIIEVFNPCDDNDQKLQQQFYLIIIKIFWILGQMLLENMLR